MPAEEERIALFIDLENLALGARDIGRGFDVRPIMDALAERGRIVARRAYADWTLFADDRRSLVQHNCELIDIPQRQGAVRKNAADIKLAVDALEMAYERSFISTFVIASGDSDFTPLVASLRALNRRVIGIGVKGSTSAILPPACDEFLFYERLPGADAIPSQRAAKSGARASTGSAKPKSAKTKERKPSASERDLHELRRTISQTLAGLKQSAAEPVLASTLKRALLRKDPTFSEGDYGFRAFGELLRQLEKDGVLALAEGAAKGDPAVDFPAASDEVEKSFELLRQTVAALQTDEDDVPLSGLKDQLRKREPGFSEKDLGYSGFLQFVKAVAAARKLVMEWDDEEGDWFLYVPEADESPPAETTLKKTS